MKICFCTAKKTNFVSKFWAVMYQNFFVVLYFCCELLYLVLSFWMVFGKWVLYSKSILGRPLIFLSVCFSWSIKCVTSFFFCPECSWWFMYFYSNFVHCSTDFLSEHESCHPTTQNQWPLTENEWIDENQNKSYMSVLRN